MDQDEHYQLLDVENVQEDQQVHRVNGQRLDDMLKGVMTTIEYQEAALTEIQIKQQREEQYTSLIDSSMQPSKVVSKTNSPKHTISASSAGGKATTEKIDRLAPMGDSVTIAYLETWLNSTLGQAESLDIPGVMKHPEHRKPLARYELDQYILQQVGLSRSDIDQLYRGLFVHSKGIFQMVKNISKKVQNKANHPDLPPQKNAENKRSYMLANIWRVFQILLEYSSPSDYELITQNMEKRSSEQIDQMKQELKVLEQQFIDKDKELQTRMKAVNDECALLEKQKIQFEIDKVAAIEGSQKAMKKLEEETVTRIRFEQKLNSLHMVNHDVDSERKLYQDKFEKLTVMHQDLVEKFIDLQNQNESLNKFKTKAQYEIVGQDKLRENFGKENSELAKNVVKLENELLELREHRKDSLFQIQSLSSELTKVSLRAAQLSNDLEATKNYANQIKGFYNQHQEKQASQGQRIEDLKRETSQQSLQISNLTTENRNLREDNEYMEAELKKVKQELLESTFKKDLYEQKYNGALLVIDSHRQNQQEFQKFTEQAHEQYLVLELNKLEQDRNLQKQIQQTGNIKKEKENAEELLKKIKRQEIYGLQRAKEAKEEIQVMIIQNEQANKVKEDLVKQHGKKLRLEQAKSIEFESSRDQIRAAYLKIKEELDGVKIQFKTCREVLQSKTEEISTLKSQLERVESELAQTQDSKQKQLQDFVDKNDEIEQMMAQNKELKKENKRYDERIKKLIDSWKEKVADKDQQLTIQMQQNEDTLSRMKSVDDKYLQLKREMEIQTEEMKYLGRKYIAFLIHKGWTRLRAQQAAERLAKSYAEIDQKEQQLLNEGLKNEELCAKIEKLEADLKSISTMFSEITKDFEREQAKLKQLKEDLASKNEKLQYLMDKYVNIERFDQCEGTECSQKNSRTSQTANIKMQAATVFDIESPELYEFYIDASGKQIMRQPGESLPESFPQESIIFKTKDVNSESFKTARKRVDVSRLMKKFKTIAQMIGKLKAAQQMGTKKRTAAEEAQRLANLAKETKQKDPSLSVGKTASNPTGMRSSKASFSKSTLDQFDPSNQNLNRLDKNEDLELYKQARKKLNIKKMKVMKEKNTIDKNTNRKQSASDVESDDFLSESVIGSTEQDEQKQKYRKSKVMYGKSLNRLISKNNVEEDSDQLKTESDDESQQDLVEQNTCQKSIRTKSRQAKQFFKIMSKQSAQSQQFVDFKNFLREINEIKEFSEFAQINFKICEPKNFKAFSLVSKTEASLQRQEALNMIENMKQISEQERTKYQDALKQYFKQALKEILPIEQKKFMINQLINREVLSQFKNSELKKLQQQKARFQSQSTSPVPKEHVLENKKLNNSLNLSNMATSQYSSFNTIRKKKNLNELEKLHAHYMPRNQIEGNELQPNHLKKPQTQQSYQERSLAVNGEALTALQKRNTLQTISAHMQSGLTPRNSSFDKRIHLSKDIPVMQQYSYPYQANKHDEETFGYQTNQNGLTINKVISQVKESQLSGNEQISDRKQFKINENKGFQTDQNFFRSNLQNQKNRMSSVEEISCGPHWLSKYHAQAQRDMNQASLQASNIKASNNYITGQNQLNEGLKIKKLIPKKGIQKFVDSNYTKQQFKNGLSPPQEEKQISKSQTHHYIDLKEMKQRKSIEDKQKVNRSITSLQSQGHDTTQTQAAMADSDRDVNNITIPAIFKDRQPVYTFNQNKDPKNADLQAAEGLYDQTGSATRGEAQLKANFDNSNNKNGALSTPHDVEINSQKFNELAEKAEIRVPSNKDIKRLRHQRISSQQNLITSLNKSLETQLGPYQVQNSYQLYEIQNLYQTGKDDQNKQLSQRPITIKAKNDTNLDSKSMQKMKLQDGRLIANKTGFKNDANISAKDHKNRSQSDNQKNRIAGNRYSNINVRKLLKIAMKN